MKKMNIRQAFAKMKKMFPGAHVTVERSYTRRHHGEETIRHQLYVCKTREIPGIWMLDKSTFEEAFEALEEEMKKEDK